MSISNYLQRLFFRLPAYDSAELIAAKKYHPSSSTLSNNIKYDSCRKEMDHFMFGAIAPRSSANDFLSSRELEKKAQVVYELCERNDHLK